MDRAWWKTYITEVLKTFKGELATAISSCFSAKHYSIPSVNNSGAGAIELAILKGASTVLLVGYDMQHTGGKKHWHGDHPRHLANAGKVSQWPAEFERLKARHKGVNIINCSRDTALTCFQRMNLEDALREFN